MQGVMNDIATRWVSATLVSAVGTDTFLSRNAKIPRGDGPYVSLVVTPGTGATYRHDSRYDHPSVQVTVRATSASAALALCQQLYENLQSARNVTLNGTFYLWILPEQPPFELPADDASRARWAFNIRVTSR